MFGRLRTFLALGMTLVAAGARAQNSELDAEFQRLVTEAVAEYEAERYPEAQALFRRAHERAPNARTLRGIGMASFELRQYSVALRALTASLGETRLPLTEEQRTHVEDLIARARNFVTRVQLEVSPAAARVRLDGSELMRESDGTILLDSGHHVFDGSADGYQPRSMSFDAQGGEEASLALDLTAVPTVPAPQPTVPQPDEGLLLVSVTLFATSGLALAASGVTGALALGGQSELRRVCNHYVCPDSAQPTLASTAQLATATDALWVTGGVLAAAGLAILLGALLAPHAPTRVMAGCTAAGCSLSLAGAL